MTYLDTRHKILTPERAVSIADSLRAEGRRLKVVSGYFDVLQPAIVRVLADHAGPGVTLLALVLDPPRPITSPSARAELAASLRVIDYVLPWSDAPDAMVERLRPAEWIREEQAHARSTQRLEEHVRLRHNHQARGGHAD